MQMMVSDILLSLVLLKHQPQIHNYIMLSETYNPL